MSDLGGVAGGASVRGASHLASGAPNQDSVGWRASGDWTMLVVADGHGARPHFRSDRGSRFAVDSALDALELTLDGGALNDPPVLLRRVADLGEAIVARWIARVEADLAADPIDAAPGFASHAVYGSTCVAVAIGPGMVVLAQIGDGEIYLARRAGDAVRGFDRDETIGQQTYSLCLPGAAIQFKCAALIHPHPLGAPDFAMVVTDGFSKAFLDERKALETAGRLRDKAVEAGGAALADDLPGLLEQCARAGGGDDVSLAFFAAGLAPA